MIGNVVGNYKITDKLGEGGMGAVFKGVDLMLEREVAIKMLRPELSSQPEVVERFRSEAVTLAKLNHPNVATLYSFLRQGDDYFMVMEFVRGETLDDVIRKHGAMIVDRAIPVFCQALEGIDHAHRMGIVHRDIKPANIMLTQEGTLKVMDFGIARVLGSARLTRQGNIIGTIEYMSPEQVRGAETDARSDIYSLGILLYEMLTGRVPFQSDSEFDLMKSQIEDAPTPPRTFAPHIALPVEQAIMRALAKKPEMRFQTAGEFRAALLGAIGLSTLPLEGAGVVYHAPATRVSQPMGTPISGFAGAPPEATKETRLGGSHIPSQPGVAPPPHSGVKETRLSDPQIAAYPPQAYQTQPGASIPGAAAPSQPAGRGFFSKLSWVHYTAAALLIAAMVGVPLAMMAGGDAPPPPVVEESAPLPAPAPPPPSQDVAPAANPNVTDAPALPPGVDSSEPRAGATGTEHAAPRSRTPRSDRAAEQPAEESAAPQPTETARPQPPPSQPPAREEKAETVKPAEEKKKEEKKGGIGGFFKKINPFKGDKKKEEKKP